MTPAWSGLLLSVVFFISATACSGILPLWLDEVLQLLETRDTPPRQLLTVLPRNPGAAPLGYLVQQATLRIVGYSVRKARLPMAVFGSASAKSPGPDALHFSIAAKTPLMVFRELAGAGYWGSGLLVILCAIALAHRNLSAYGLSASRIVLRSRHRAEREVFHCAARGFSDGC